MTSDFLYPQIDDRRSTGEWQDGGAPDIWKLAHCEVRAILAAPAPAVIDPDLAARLQAEFRADAACPVATRNRGAVRHRIAGDPA